MREIHSFGSAFAQDEPIRLLEGSAGLDVGPGHLLIEHLEGCRRDAVCEASSRSALPPATASRGRKTLSLWAHLCELLREAVRRGTGDKHTHRGLQP